MFVVDLKSMPVNYVTGIFRFMGTYTASFTQILMPPNGYARCRLGVADRVGALFGGIFTVSRSMMAR